MENLINIIRETNNTLINNDNLATVETNLLIENAATAVIENENEVLEEEEEAVIENEVVDETDDAKKKFYQLLYLNQDFQKKLRENSSIIKRKKEHFELIQEIKNAYSKATKERTRREKYLFHHQAIFSLDGEDKIINKEQINEEKPLIYTYLENLHEDIKKEHFLNKNFLIFY